ncbi:MAG TPA: dihydrofolate reductase [Candidatus Binatia bacterium]|nr:dihydrofolate reductase [Candidatus Binatia bacterium]
MKISAVVTTNEDGAIASDGKVPWRAKGDLPHFRQLTSGHSVIMGRKTFEAIGQPLPNRQNIVLTRNKDYQAAGAEIVHSIDQALSLAEASGKEIFMIGGADIYDQFMPLTDKIYLTLVHTGGEGDRFFKFDPRQWRQISRESYKKDDLSKFDRDYLVYERR